MASKAIKCIWMEAGAVEYQMCPLNLNCDHCDFYHEMASGYKTFSRSSTDPTYVTFQKPYPSLIDFIPGIQYLPGHFWVKHIARDRVILGLDDLIWKLLHPLKAVILSDPGTHISTQSCFAWVVVPTGIVYLKIPVTGVVCKQNDLFSRSQQLRADLKQMSVEDKWLLDININPDDFSNLHLLSKEEYLKSVEQDCNNIYGAVSEQYHAAMTLNGGGQFEEPAGDRLILEKHNFSTLLKDSTQNGANMR